MPLKFDQFKLLLEGIPQLARDKGWTLTTPWTKEIMRVFAQYGKEQGFDVCTQNDEARFGEWLFDLTYLKGEMVDGTYRLKECPLILESEWGGHTEVIDDFSKLLVANSSLRIMIYEAKNKGEQTILEREMLTLIEEYSPSTPGVRFYFACFQEWSRNFEFFEIITPDIPSPTMPKIKAVG